MPVIEHAFFGRLEFEEADDIGEYGNLCDLQPISFRGVALEATLYYSLKDLAGLTAQSLDPHAALVARLDELDAIARAHVRDTDRVDWLVDRMDPEAWRFREMAAEAQAKMREIFPVTPVLSDVTAEQFGRALRLTRLGFSIELEGSGGPALTLDYRILPDELDNYIFAAKFAPDGHLISVDVES